MHPHQKEGIKKKTSRQKLNPQVQYLALFVKAGKSWVLVRCWGDVGMGTILCICKRSN
jgi:hypothetical protein